MTGLPLGFVRRGCHGRCPGKDELVRKPGLSGMRQLRAAVLSLLVPVVAAGCTAAAPGLRAIADPTQRVEVSGLSILPPQGDNWFRASGPPQQEDVPGITLVGFVKKLWDAPPSRAEEARLVYARVNAYELGGGERFDTPAQLLEYVKRDSERRTGEMVTRRQRLLGLEAVLDDSLGATCVRYSRLAELRGWGPFPESVFILATRGLYCLHPDWPRYMIDVGYTQLYLKGQEPLPLDTQVEPFLKSPVFTATRPVAEAPEPARWASHMETGAKAYDRRRWSDAEAAFKAALEEAEHSFGARDRRLADTLWHLASVHHHQGRRDEAEPLYRRALAIYEQHPGADQRRYAQTLNDLGVLYRQQGQHERAEGLLQRALAVREVALGPEDLDVGQSLSNLMELYARRGQLADAEPFARRALAIYERAKGPNDKKVGWILHVLGHVLDGQGKVADAEPLLRRGLAIAEKVFGLDHPEVAHQLEDYAAVLRKMNRAVEAAELEARAKAIRAKSLQEIPAQ